MSESPGSSSRTLFPGAAAGLLASFAVLLVLRDWNARLPAFLAVYGTAAVAYGIAAREALRGSFDVLPGVPARILAVAVLIRILAFACPPSLSEDVYRYIWDGRVQNAGYGPYTYPPRAPELAQLRDADYEKLNHKEFRTAYPPAAELLFRALAAISTRVTAFKLAVLGFDLLLIAVLRLLLIHRGLPPAYLLVYAWHPLAAVEFAGSGHLDVIALSLMFVSLLLLERRRPAAAGAALGVAVLTKYLPALALPWVARRGGWKMAAALVVTCIILFISYYKYGSDMFYGLFVFYRKWWFNDSIFSLLRWLFHGAEPARLAGGTAMAITAALCLWKRLPVERSFFLLNATLIAFAPVVHPWYVCWLIPFLVFHRNATWHFFTLWVAVSYLIRYFNPGEVWERMLWLKFVVYVPLYAGLLWDGVRMMRGWRAEGPAGSRRSL